MFARTKQDARKTVKHTLSADEARRKREDASNELRKSKREESLQKRRFVTGSDPAGTDVTPQQQGPMSTEILPQHVQAIFSEDSNAQLEATTHFRKLLSIERNPPIQQVIQSGIVPRLVQFLANSVNLKLQFEAAWALTNIGSGTHEQTGVLLQCGVVPVFVQLLSHSDEELREQAVWALGNIAGDCVEFRDFVLQCGILMPLLNILNQNGRVSMMRNSTWALSNLCRGKPQPQFSAVSPSLPVLARLIFNPDQEIITDACWALSYLSDGNDDTIQAVVDAGVCPRLVQLLSYNSFSVQTPALRAVGNIVTGNDSQTQTILDLKGLPALYNLLQSQRRSLRKEAAWTISNVTAGNRNQTQQVIDANLVPQLVNLLSNAEFEVKKEAAWALSNATTWKVPSQIKHLVTHGVLKPLVDMLTAKDVKVVCVCLDALENILSVGESVANKTGNGNPYVSLVDEADGIEKLEQLQQHENNEVYQKAMKILEEYLGAEEDNENLAPSSANTSQPVFNFSANVPTGGFVF